MPQVSNGQAAQIVASVPNAGVSSATVAHESSPVVVARNVFVPFTPRARSAGSVTLTLPTPGAQSQDVASGMRATSFSFNVNMTSSGPETSQDRPNQLNVSFVIGLFGAQGGGAQSESLLELHPPGQQPSPETQALIGTCLQLPLQLLGLPANSSFVHALPSLQLDGQETIGSQVSPRSTTPLPQTGQVPSTEMKSPECRDRSRTQAFGDKRSTTYGCALCPVAWQTPTRPWCAFVKHSLASTNVDCSAATASASSLSEAFEAQPTAAATARTIDPTNEHFAACFMNASLPFLRVQDPARQNPRAQLSAS